MENAGGNYGVSFRNTVIYLYKNIISLIYLLAGQSYNEYIKKIVTNDCGKQSEQRRETL